MDYQRIDGVIRMTNAGDTGQWQPIESAPKDGTALLVIDMGSQDPKAALVHWGRHWSHGKDHAWLIGHKEEWVRYSSHQDAWMPTPTHWMPLPAPPGATHDAGEGK